MKVRIVVWPAIESWSDQGPDANSSLSDTDETSANRRWFRSAVERFDLDCTLGIVACRGQFLADRGKLSKEMARGKARTGRAKSRGRWLNLSLPSIEMAATMRWTCDGLAIICRGGWRADLPVRKLASCKSSNDVNIVIPFCVSPDAAQHSSHAGRGVPVQPPGASLASEEDKSRPGALCSVAPSKMLTSSSQRAGGTSVGFVSWANEIEMNIQPMEWASLPAVRPCLVSYFWNATAARS